MLAIQIIVTFGVIFIAGMHYAMWDNFHERKSAYFCIGMSLIGVWNLISLVGYVAKYG
jgi:hypothetical protein